jgi:hypothetical protein
MAIETSVMAYWYNLAWQVKERVIDEQGHIIHGLIERMEGLKFDIVLEKATVKKKAVAEVKRDIYGNVVTKGKKGKEKVQTVKQQYIVPKFKEQTMTFSTVYQVATGTTDILGKIEEIKNMMGSSSPLVIGTEYYDKVTGEMTSWPHVIGVFQMQLTKISVSETELDDIGRMTKAKVAFTLTETTEEAVKKAAIQSPSAATLSYLQSWAKTPFIYTEVDPKTYTKKTNPKKNGWYELVNGEYVATKDKKVVAGKTYYTREANSNGISEEYWSAMSISPDPTVKAMVKQHKKDKKASTKAAKSALKLNVKELQESIRAGTYSGGTISG